MKTSRSMFVRGLGAAVTLAAVALCSLNAQAEIVFGNLGASGTNAISTTTTDLGTQTANQVNWLAQGFNTGTSSLLTVNSVTLGIFGASEGTLPLTVSIFSSSAGLPNQSLYTSSATNVGLQDKYAFSFSGAVLQPNTTYFVVPNGGSWYWNTGSPAGPIGQNGSGYSTAGTFESLATTSTPSGPWDTASATRYSVSVEAVPEPSTVVLAGLGVAGLAIMERGRRQRRKARTATAMTDVDLG